MHRKRNRATGPNVAITTCLLIALFVPPLAAYADALDDIVIELMRKKSVPGLSLAVIDDGKIVKARAYGVVQMGSDTPVTEAMLFQAGSVSKPVAAFGALRLVAAGKLSLDADVNVALKSWQVPPNELTKAQPVTLHGLLSHTAGLTVHGFRGYAIDSELPTLLQVLNGDAPANSAPIVVDVVPGSAFRYSGGGYTVMQQLVIDVTSTPFPAFMRESVLDPLGMKASTFEQPLPPAKAAMTVIGHDGGKPVPGRWHVYPEMAAAGLWATPADLARFAIGVQNAVAGKQNALLSQTLARRMLTPVKERYALGFALAGSANTQRFLHDGRDEGFDTLLVAYRDIGKGAVVMINKNDNSSFKQRVLSAIATQYSWPDFQPYGPPTPIADEEPALTLQVRTILGQAQAGRFDRALYTDAFAAVLEKEIPDGDAGRELRSLGELKSLFLYNRRSKGEDRIYHYLIAWENAETRVTCVFNAEGKISEIDIRPE